MNIVKAKAFVCEVCGYLHLEDRAPDACPQCGAPDRKLIEQGRILPFAEE